MRKLNLSLLPERIIGFTIPKAGTFYICDHDEVWRVAIGLAPAVQVTDLEPYKFVESRADFLGLLFEGSAVNEPLLPVGQNKIDYDFDPKKNFVAVRYTVGGESGRIEFPILSGDWFAASFSDDGRHLLLAEPYDVALYEIA
jgi:hypothetical protein